MTVELVVARYCEDLSWLEQAPAHWRVTIYDKSAGGPRERIHLPGYSSPDGPSFAETWPDAIPMANVGLGDRSYLHHVARNYYSLADRTVFLQGDTAFHAPDWVEHVRRNLREHYAPFGDVWTCDADGRPHFDAPLTELADMHRLFLPDVDIPATYVWHPWSMFAASSERLTRIPRSTWARAEQAVVTKRHSCAMERLYDSLLGDADTPWKFAYANAAGSVGAR